MKKRMITVLSAVLMLGISGCSADKEPELIIDAAGDNTIMITADKAAKGGGGISTITIPQNSVLTAETDLSEGVLTITLSKADAGSQAEPLATYELKGTETTEYSFEPDEYNISIEVSEKATGTVTLSTRETEDGQNPVMNFIGMYASGRCSIEVSAGSGDLANFNVRWGSSAAEHTEWVMSGHFDTDTLTVEYDDCTKTDYVFNSDGSVSSETVQYENGKGRMIFSEEGSLHLSWEDDEENAAEGMTFGYAN